MISRKLSSYMWLWLAVAPFLLVGGVMAPGMIFIGCNQAIEDLRKPASKNGLSGKSARPLSHKTEFWLAQKWTPKGRSGIMVLVPAGEFIMGSSNNTNHPEEHPAHPVYLDAYYIDKYEVTVAEYAKCHAAGKCATPATGLFYNFGQPGKAHHPINGVSWHDAVSYCRWVKKRLPTEAEWEKAARGTDGRVYPWGNEDASCNYAVINEHVTQVPEVNSTTGCGVKSTWPVGSKPKGISPYGALDMAGNVWEWVSDWYDTAYYATSPGKNPQGPSSGTLRTLRGGAWNHDWNCARTADRGWSDPQQKNVSDGFRCAKTR